MHALQDNT